MSDTSNDEATTVRFLDDRPAPAPAPAPAAFTVPQTDARLALYAVHDGRLAHMMSAEDGDAFGERMIALGRSYRRGLLARLLRRR